MGYPQGEGEGALQGPCSAVTLLHRVVLALTLTVFSIKRCLMHPSSALLGISTPSVLPTPGGMKAALMVSLWQPHLGSWQLILPAVRWLFKGVNTGRQERLAAAQEELSVSGCNRHLQRGFLPSSFLYHQAELQTNLSLIPPQSSAELVASNLLGGSLT